MIGDRELREFRRGYYEVLFAFLAREPSASFLEHVTRGIVERARAAREVHPALGDGWGAIGDILIDTSAAGAAAAGAEEFTALFIGPFETPVHPYESYYLTRRFYDRPLATVRGFLTEVGIERDPAYADPEDSLAFELSIMAQCIDRQGRATEPDTEAHWLGRQAVFLKEHLLVWGPRCAADIAAAPGARLYRGVGRLLEGFLDLERDLFREWGPPGIPTLDEARAAASQGGVWRGPLFATPPEAGGEEASPPEGTASAPLQS